MEQVYPNRNPYQGPELGSRVINPIDSEDIIQIESLFLSRPSHGAPAVEASHALPLDGGVKCYRKGWNEEYPDSVHGVSHPH